ncbi:HD domain-containing protein [Malacoplasma iowae]|uniref:HD domain-containing protein n=1 Tax=Malacoplasma iowae TaxID=2116 RepID=UPI001E2B6AA3|nr:HD domain-containing protein [Malacoplasma iowae]
MTENLIRRLSFLTLQLKKHNFSEKEIKLIKKAYDFAYRKHGTQTRKSGEPYIVHPLEVAITLTEWKMDKDTIITGLLHDVLEDTDCEESEIESRFGSKVLEMVLAVTKVSKLSEENRTRENLENANNEYLIKVMMSVTKDLRPIMVKIADRMHNMYTISHLKKENKKE